MIPNNQFWFNNNRAGVPIDSDAQLYFDESTTPLSNTEKQAINWGILDLKNTGNWNKLSFFFFGATSNQDLSNSNVKNPTHKLTEVVSDTWQDKQWWSANGVGHINYNWNPLDDGGLIYTRNNAGYTIYPMVHALLSEDRAIFGAIQTSNNSNNDIICSGGALIGAVNSDTQPMTNPKSAGVITITRTNSTELNFYRQGILKNTDIRNSETIANVDWFGLTASVDGVRAGLSANKILCILAHTGDVNVSDLNQTIKGIISRLNGGYEMTTLTENIVNMNPMDSCLLAQLDADTLICCGGYDVLEPSQATDRVWTSTDGITWTERTSMPFDVAHAVGGLMGDGFFHLLGSKQTNEPFHIKMDPSDYSWTIVNTDLGGVGQPLEGYFLLQWGGLFNGELKMGASNDGGVTIRTASFNYLTGWTFNSNLPISDLISAGVSIVGTTMRLAGGGKVVGGLTTVLNNKIFESTDNCATWNEIRTLPSELLGTWPVYDILNGIEFYSVGRNTQYSVYEGGIYKWTGTEWLNTLLPELSSRHAVASRVFKNEIYYLNGFLFNDCYKLGLI